MIIGEREVSSDNSVAGTRNFLSFDDAAPTSDMVLFSPTETRESQAKALAGDGGFSGEHRAAQFPQQCRRYAYLE
jgi:hypothetical protein